MSNLCQSNRLTPQRVIRLFQDDLKGTCLGDWHELEDIIDEQ